ncbi:MULTISPECIES: hypothetical protein [Amycolatopsis]|uniref:hypothetical protein n=1 Tax=Amycolatopsis sp. cg13 TaxID=3238807 RepID=UPI003524CDD5
MELTERLAAVTALFEVHRKAPFPSRYRGGADVAGFDMVLLDAHPAGCVSTWLQRQGLLDDWRWNILAEYKQRLIRVIPELDAYGREYYQRLLDMTVLVLEADSP